MGRFEQRPSQPIDERAKPLRGAARRRAALENQTLNQSHGSLEGMFSNANAVLTTGYKESLGLQTYTDTPELNLSMFDKSSLASGGLDHMGERYFGSARLWVAGRARESKEEAMQKRDAKLEAAYFRKNPEGTRAEFALQRETAKKRTDELASKRIYDTFRSSIREDMQVTGETPMHFADRHLRIAGNTYNRTWQNLYPQKASPLRSEASMKIISPARVIQTLASPNTSEALRDHTVKRLLLARISGEIDGVGRVEEGGVKLAQVQDVLDTYLFAGEVGSASPVKLRAAFENGTNKPLAVEGINGVSLETPLETGQHIKTITLPMRSIQGSDMQVYTNPDEKTFESGTEKAIKKAVNRFDETGDGTIRPSVDVRDTNRMLIVVKGTHQDAKQLTGTITQILSDHQDQLTGLDDYGRPTNLEGGNVVRVVPDTKTNSSQDQGAVQFERIQVYFSDLPNPIEIIVQSAEDFLDAKYSSGIFDDKKKKYTGNSHDLYDWKRSDVIGAKLLNGYYDQNEALQAYHQTAKNLRRIRRDTIK